RAHLDALKAARKAYINTQILHYKHQAAQLYGEHGTSSNAHKKERNIMKKLFTTAICLILLGLSADAQAKNLIIGLSPVLNKQDTRKQNMQVLHYLSENLEAGQEVLLFDAENRRYLGTFKKPVNKNYANIKALLQYNRSLISVLRAMNQTDHPALSEGTKGSVKIPQFLTFLAQNYAPLKDTDIVILGSPIYVDLQTPAWDMRGGRYPGDGHFGMQFNQSIFSTSGKENYLKGARIHIGFSDKDWAINETYAYFVKRMWTLYIEAQGGVLSSFTDDKTTLWNRVNRSAKALPHNFKRDMTDKLEMFEMPPASSKQVSIHARELTTILPTSDILRMAQNVEIGINWTCKKCDLDLYVRPHHAAKVLYFGHTKSELGLYHKDYTQSPKTVNGYETVTFTSTVDLNDTLIAINWYGGIALSGVTGEIRLAIGSKTYGLPFKITAKKGNAGNGRGQIIEFGKSANSNWLVISPEQILGLK
ncbi:MAG: hypothetical protein KAS59_07915, partial [Alphaproteobacteria bacterium]|nr:hypothetical protein [Alphaproteobacteria bacterium]